MPSGQFRRLGRERGADAFLRQVLRSLLDLARPLLLFGQSRSLDDLVRAMLAERRAGRPMDRALFERLLHAELGDDGLAGLEAMLAGDTVLPSPDAFGPCFTRVTRPLRVFLTEAAEPPLGVASTDIDLRSRENSRVSTLLHPDPAQ